MAFLINETGIEDYATGSPQVVFDSPVIIAERDAETAADAVHDVALSGAPVVVVYTRTQSKSFLRLYVRRIVGTDLANLRALMAAGKLVKVKLEAGNASTIDCMFGPRSMQKLSAYTGDHPDAKGDGTAIDPLLLQYQAELVLLRFS
jgi:hypothetical protein